MESPKNKADVRWMRTRERLLKGGRKAFAERGVEATTVQEIVRAAGVSQPSFYNHFQSRQELAQEIAAEFFRRDRAAKAKVFAAVDDPAEAIAINVYHTLAIANDDPVIAWTLLKSETMRDLVISSNTDPLADMIASGIAAGRFADTDPRTLALVIRGGAFAVIKDMLNSGKDESMSVYQELVLRMLGLDAAASGTVVASARQKIMTEVAA